MLSKTKSTMMVALAVLVLISFASGLFAQATTAPSSERLWIQHSGCPNATVAATISHGVKYTAVTSAVASIGSTIFPLDL